MILLLLRYFLNPDESKCLPQDHSFQFVIWVSDVYMINFPYHRTIPLTECNLINLTIQFLLFKIIPKYKNMNIRLVTNRGSIYP